MDKNILKERYEPPEVEILLAEVERGFAGSESGATTPDWKVISEDRGDDYSIY